MLPLLWDEKIAAGTTGAVVVETYLRKDMSSCWDHKSAASASHKVASLVVQHTWAILVIDCPGFDVDMERRSIRPGTGPRQPEVVDLESWAVVVMTLQVCSSDWWEFDGKSMAVKEPP